jgi:peroxiredoxin (alkyl hydroperoxide reductase subunit C)
MMVGGYEMLQFFAPRGPNNQPMQIPSAYRETTCWQPRIGDAFPKFAVATTEGDRNFADWAKGTWTYFFSQPAAYSPICTAELIDFGTAATIFRKHGIQLMSLSVASVQDQQAWREEISNTCGVKVDFPGASDPKLKLAKCFGALHPKEAQSMMIRKSFVIGPDLCIRAIMEYPINAARRSKDALNLIRQLQDPRIGPKVSIQSRPERDQGAIIVPRRPTGRKTGNWDSAAIA